MDTLRLSLHILAATIWVGGQFTLAALVPVVRKSAPELTAALARRFAVVAWWAYGVLFLTGWWNLQVISHELTENHQWGTFGAKTAAVVISGVAALIHQRTKNKTMLAVFGAISGISAILIVVLGVALAEA